MASGTWGRRVACWNGARKGWGLFWVYIFFVFWA
ncbi:hypothetical protein F383_00297 [Gossypium arboreum]|uniref:Uncharacterized protein n=1 Tax=Gossypium arboreum TaxID=29729 RepID=A0A0B0NFM7_GOSAR|nr:hypothetical protein F383_00297 [Gossypium arboreum]